MKYSNKLLSVEDAENLKISEIQELYKKYISKSQVELIGSFGFGNDLVDSYVKLKNQDWSTFNKHLTSWERETTLDC